MLGHVGGRGLVETRAPFGRKNFARKSAQFSTGLEESGKNELVGDGGGLGLLRTSSDLFSPSSKSLMSSVVMVILVPE